MVLMVISRRAAVAGLIGGVAGAAAISRSVSPAAVRINLADFGVSPSAKPQQNYARFRKALADAPPGAVVVLPASEGGACRIDTRRGWQNALQIDKPLTLQIDGDLQATYSAMQTSPPFMFNVTSRGVTLTGSGRIIGDGSIDDSNSGIDETLPGLVRVAADDFTMTDIEIVAPPKVGLLLYQCNRAQIRGVKFTGGPKVYGGTGHFAVRAAGGGQHVFEQNRFYPTPDGGMCVQCIMLSGSSANIFTGNHATHPYEKLIYGWGDRNIARNNIVVGNPGMVPGTNIRGTITGVFRFHGSFNRVEANHTTNCAGGAQMMDGTGHVVIDNRFLACGQSGISAYQSDLSGSTFKNNVCTRGALAGFVAGDGFRLISDRAGATGVVIEGNQVSGFSIDDPIEMVAPWKRQKSFGQNSLIKPTRGNGRYYTTSADGISGAQEPRWPSTPGATVIDGTIIWTAVAYEGGQAEIKLSGRSVAEPIKDSVVRNNTVRGGRLGIVTQFVTHSRITGNRVTASSWGLVENGGGYNRWQGNRVQGAAGKAVHNLASTSLSRE